MYLLACTVHVYIPWLMLFAGMPDDFGSLSVLIAFAALPILDTIPFHSQLLIGPKDHIEKQMDYKKAFILMISM